LLSIWLLLVEVAAADMPVAVAGQVDCLLDMRELLLVLLIL
jgi:hypothetical protein